MGGTIPRLVVLRCLRELAKHRLRVNQQASFSWPCFWFLSEQADGPVYNAVSTFLLQAAFVTVFDTAHS